MVAKVAVADLGREITNQLIAGKEAPRGITVVAYAAASLQGDGAAAARLRGGKTDCASAAVEATQATSATSSKRFFFMVESS